MKLFLFVVVFLLLGAFFIISENKLALKSPEARKELGRLYYSWFNQIFENSKNIIGYIIKLDWLPENKTKS